MKSLLAFALITANFSFVLAAPSLLKRSQRIIDPSCKDYQESIGGALTDALYYAQLGLDVLKLERSESQDDLLWALFAPSDLFGENVPIEIPTGVTKTSKISELVGVLEKITASLENADAEPKTHIIYCNEDYLKSIIPNYKEECNYKDLTGNWAFTTHPEGEFSEMHTVICPRSFQDFPRRITDVPAPALGTPIQNIYTLGSVMLHELVHAAGMIDKDLAYLWDSCLHLKEGQFTLLDKNKNLMTGVPSENAESYAFFTSTLTPASYKFNWQNGKAEPLDGEENTS